MATNQDVRLADDDAAAESTYDCRKVARSYWAERTDEQRQACRVAGLALYLYGELPRPDGVNSAREHVCKVVAAAHHILPGQCYLSPPEDREEFAARVRIARALVSDADGIYEEDCSESALLAIAADALDSLAGLLGP